MYSAMCDCALNLSVTLVSCYRDCNMVKWILILCIFLCGTAICIFTYDETLTVRRLIWCMATIAMVAISKDMRINPFALGFLGFVLLSGIFATNHS